MHYLGGIKLEDINQQMENQYTKEYNDDSFFRKIKKTALKCGVNVVYACLLLYFTLQKPLTPGWAKAKIMGALGYFILPVDAITDITPIVGYTDDLGVLILALGTVAIYIDDEVKQKAKIKLKDWFGEYDESQLDDIESKLKKEI
jgi:uncharacterized membrane protein YkvA (DUF1232 family)